MIEYLLVEIRLLSSEFRNSAAPEFRQFDAEEKAIARKVLQGLILQHQAKRWTREASG